jgi:hypothetical protein
MTCVQPGMGGPVTQGDSVNLSVLLCWVSWGFLTLYLLL